MNGFGSVFWNIGSNVNNSMHILCGYTKIGFGFFGQTNILKLFIIN